MLYSITLRTAIAESSGHTLGRSDDDTQAALTICSAAPMIARI